MDSSYTPVDQQSHHTNDYHVRVEHLLECLDLYNKGDFRKSLAQTTEQHRYWYDHKAVMVDTLIQEHQTSSLEGFELVLLNFLYVGNLIALDDFQQASTYSQEALKYLEKYNDYWSLFHEASLPEAVKYIPLYIFFFNYCIHKNREAIDTYRIQKDVWEKLNEYLQVLPQVQLHCFVPQKNFLVRSGWLESAEDIYYNLPDFLFTQKGRDAFLEKLVPGDFQSQPFIKKHNTVSENPLVSICIPSFQDGEWLKFTVDGVIKNAGYENYEILVIQTKLDSADTTGNFLSELPYATNSKIKHFVYDYRMGSEGAKHQIAEMAQGEIICSLESHCLPSVNFVKKAVDHFLRNRNVHVLAMSGLATSESKKVRGAKILDNIPKFINGIVGVDPVVKPLQKADENGLYKRLNLDGYAYFITKDCFFDVFGYQILPYHSWGDRTFGMNIFLCGYDIYADETIVAIHKWHDIESSHWVDTVRKTNRFEYEHDLARGALTVGYVYFSKEYFEQYMIPWVKDLAKDNYDYQYAKFVSDLPYLIEYKKQFWNRAVRSVKDYILEYWEQIYDNLSPSERRVFSAEFRLK